MSPKVDALLRVTLPSSSGPRAVELRIPSIHRLSSLLHDDGSPRGAELLALWMPNFVTAFVTRVDGKRLQYERTNALCADPTFMRALIPAVRAILDTLRERGKVFVLCPGCESWEPEVSFTAFALTIACPIPSTFEGAFLAVPSVAWRVLLGEARPPLPRARRIRFELPSFALGMAAPIQGAVLGEVRYQPEEDLPPPKRAAGDVDDDDDDDDDEDEEEIDEKAVEDDAAYPPNRRGGGWHAVLRLARAIEPPVTVEVLEQLPAIDFFFLDLVHFLVAKAPVRPDTPGVIECPKCHTRFLPVRPDYKARP